LAGLVTAREQGLVGGDDIAVIDSTAHALKFAGFQQMYFEQQFPPEYGITVDPQLINAPLYLHLQDLEKLPAPGNPLNGLDLDLFVQRVSEEIADRLNLKKP
jgi:threonine synthase